MKNKEITIYDLALKLNISPATVSRGLKDHPAINKTTKKRIFELAEELGYRTNHFARNLRNQSTHSIGVLIPRFNSSFMSTVVSGIEKIANYEGYSLLISQSSEDVDKEVVNAKTLFNSRVDGLLVSLSYNTDNLDHFAAFQKKNIPVIFFDRGEEHENFTNIVIDNRKAAYDATTHLIQQGCKKIIHITAPLKRNVYVDRFAGFKQAMLENGLEVNDDSLVIGNLSQEAGAEAAEMILSKRKKPDGVFVANDNCAVGCMLTLKKAGINIPEQIAFVGFNNDPVSEVVEPNLSTINYPGNEMGEAAARSLINHLKGISPIASTNKIILRSELIIRASSLRKQE